jgi:hypothetical protein
MRYILPGRHDVEVIDKDKLEVGELYFGYMPMGKIFEAIWNGSMFRASTGEAPELFYPEDGPEKLTFVPSVALNQEDATFAVKYTILYGNTVNSILYFRRGMPYARALECAEGIADALGLKRGLPMGLHWLSVMDFEINEAIDIEIER